MDRLSELLVLYSEQTMEIELVDLLIEELNNRAVTIGFLGEQLDKLKGLNDAQT